MKKRYTSFMKMALSTLVLFSALSSYGQSPLLETHQLSDEYVAAPTGSSSSLLESCTITNIQGALASGTLSLYAIAGRGIYTYIDPSGTGGAGDPGCFLDQPYPFTITNVQLNAFAAGGFGIAAAEGVGTMVYKVSIFDVVDNAGCTEIGANLYTSPDQTFAVTVAANQYPQTIPVGIDVNDGFFVFVETVSWSGAANRSPSLVLWNNGGVPACRQYVANFDMDMNPTLTDFTTVFTTLGWTNLIVNGTAPDVVGDIDIAVTNVAGPADYTQGIGATITANVTNLGDASLPGVVVTLTANGTTVGTQTINAGVGVAVPVSFAYTPAAAGPVSLVVSTDEDGDVNTANNSATLDIVVNAPSDPCIFSDDIESYALGAVSPQNAQWVLWTPAAPASDGFVSTEQALSGTQSVRTDGATDLLYLLGNQASGTWRVAMNLYVPTGNGGYFNIQKTQTPGQQFAVEVALLNTGTGSVNAGTIGAATFNYAQGQWNEFAIVIDIEANIANLSLNGTLIHQWPYSWQANSTAAGGLTTIGAINFYPTGGTMPLMYIDDVSFCQFDNVSPCQALQLVEGVAVVGDNTGATPFDPTLVADAAGCWLEETNTIDGDVWFSFNVPSDGSYTVTTALEVLANNDTQMLVYTSSDGTCDGDLTAIGCNDDVSTTNFLSEVFLEGLTAGTTIYILIDGYDGTEGLFQIGVFAPNPPANDLCGDAVNITPLTAGATGTINTSATFTNVDATAGNQALPSCFEDGDDGSGSLENTTWYTFTGTGNTYFISTNDCAGTAADYIDFGDTQMVIFTGACGSLAEVACNEDIDFDADIYEAGVEFPTEAGVTYTIMVDGFGGVNGEFCISFENLGDPDGLEELAAIYGVKVYPNPAADFARIHADKNMSNVILLNSVGQLVEQLNTSANTDIVLDVSRYAAGLYFVQMTIDGNVITQKLNIQ